MFSNTLVVCNFLKKKLNIMKEIKYPRSFSHIGISVPDIEKAVKFYNEVIGWYVIMKPSVVKKERETAIGQMCIDVFGEDWEEFEIAHMSTSDGIGIELFSFPNGEKNAPEFKPFNTGLFHFCVQDPDIEGLTHKIIENGGKQRMPIREYYPNEKPYKMVYVEDPFGIIFEIYTHSYELTYSS
jgi:lactoylglutathione lyase family protein